MSNSGKLFDAKDIYKLRRNNEGGSKIGLFLGGATPSNSAVIDKITFNGGNATDFGNLTLARHQAVGGGNTPSQSNIIDYITIATTGNAADFGDMLTVNDGSAGASDSHGGLQS